MEIQAAYRLLALKPTPDVKKTWAFYSKLGADEREFLAHKLPTLVTGWFSGDFMMQNKSERLHSAALEARTYDKVDAIAVAMAHLQVLAKPKVPKLLYRSTKVNKEDEQIPVGGTLELNKKNTFSPILSFSDVALKKFQAYDKLTVSWKPDRRLVLADHASIKIITDRLFKMFVALDAAHKEGGDPKFATFYRSAAFMWGRAHKQLDDYTDEREFIVFIPGNESIKTTVIRNPILDKNAKTIFEPGKPSKGLPGVPTTQNFNWGPGSKLKDTVYKPKFGPELLGKAFNSQFGPLLVIGIDEPSLVRVWQPGWNVPKKTGYKSLQMQVYLGAFKAAVPASDMTKYETFMQMAHSNAQKKPESEIIPNKPWDNVFKKGGKLPSIGPKPAYGFDLVARTFNSTYGPLIVTDLAGGDNMKAWHPDWKHPEVVSYLVLGDKVNRKEVEHALPYSKKHEFHSYFLKALSRRQELEKEPGAQAEKKSPTLIGKFYMTTEGIGLIVGHGTGGAWLVYIPHNKSYVNVPESGIKETIPSWYVTKLEKKWDLAELTKAEHTAQQNKG
ncbi:hypothetical protein [Achromobacter phage Motura]|uniref:Uncharacterized protein n=1 Tax=Achromobacter phage Motura TaxID=2591403 RepID=A0A514CT02_9CAUD|nr:hypothetical protein H1O15_gp177 [Achromobacter phage Motura]QDH83611.1 hypothetical protein [Achromobacter phage Motura]